jgi:hypothetical protein
VNAPTITTIKKLFAVSGNQCAFHGCTERIVDENGTLLGEVCHIRGDKPGAKRYDATQTEAERQGFGNLILLCPNHHTIIDADEDRFSASTLRRMKKRHEDKSKTPFVISDKMAERIIVLMGGAVVGAGLTELAKGLGHVFGSISSVLRPLQKSKKKEEPHEIVRREVAEILRYAPKGSFAVFANERTPQALCTYFAELFTTNGWRLLQQPAFKVSEETLRNFDATTFGMAFFMPDRHQLSNAQQAIEEVFTKYQFKRTRRTAGDEWFGAEHGFRAFILMAATK